MHGWKRNSCGGLIDYTFYVSLVCVMTKKKWLFVLVFTLKLVLSSAGRALLLAAIAADVAVFSSCCCCMSLPLPHVARRLVREGGMGVY